jgi:hypothetical protein
MLSAYSAATGGSPLVFDTVLNGAVRALAFAGVGSSLVAGGDFTTATVGPTGNSVNHVARFDLNGTTLVGSYVSSFTPTGTLGTNGSVYSIAPSPANFSAFALAGDFSGFGPSAPCVGSACSTRVGLISGTSASPFGSFTGVSTQSGPDALVRTAFWGRQGFGAGGIYLGGDFGSYGNGFLASGVVRVDQSTGYPDSRWLGAGATGKVYTVVPLPQGLLIGGDFTSYRLRQLPAVVIVDYFTGEPL